MNDLGSLNYFLGLEVSSSSYGYYLIQAKYAFDILSRVRPINVKTTNMPLETNIK